ncbi:MAG: hypothetical protein ACTSRG_20675 [Candidatus Helarchaeota archaeon]
MKIYKIDAVFYAGLNRRMRISVYKGAISKISQSLKFFIDNHNREYWLEFRDDLQDWIFLQNEINKILDFINRANDRIILWVKNVHLSFIIQALSYYISRQRKIIQSPDFQDWLDLKKFLKDHFNLSFNRADHETQMCITDYIL